MVKKSEKILSGMKEICAFVQRSESTVLQWVRTKNFPARKVGGIWMSDREKAEAWAAAQVEAERSDD